MVVHRRCMYCSIEHVGAGGDRRQGDRGTNINIVDASCCRVPSYPCPRILAVGISHHGGGSGSRSPPWHFSSQSDGRIPSEYADAAVTKSKAYRPKCAAMKMHDSARATSPQLNAKKLMAIQCDHPRPSPKPSHSEYSPRSQFPRTARLAFT